MTELETSKPTSSRPPPSGLVAHARLARARQHLLTGLDHLCGHVEQSDDEPPSSRPATGVQLAMVGRLLQRQLEFDLSQLSLVAFPSMPELLVHHDTLTGKLSDLERALAAGCGFERIYSVAKDLRYHVLGYFEWLDGFFGQMPRSYP